MEVFKAIKERRSIRKFKKKLVPYELLTEALDAARWAPSAGNLQPHEFIIVEDDDILAAKEVLRSQWIKTFSTEIYQT